MSEKLNNTYEDESNKTKTTDWDSLAEVPFNDGETSSERLELEGDTLEKLHDNKKAKKILSKIVLGAVVAAGLVGGALGFSEKMEQKQDAEPSLSMSNILENAKVFVDKDGDDFMWSESISVDHVQLQVEDFRVYKNGVLADMNNETYQEWLDSETPEIRMGWWEGKGPMYQAIDSDADGTWDTVHRLTFNENGTKDQLDTIDLNEDEELDGANLTMSSIEDLFNQQD